MAFESISPNMNLILPGVGQTLGPQYATDLNNSLTLIDQHNHTAGYGVPIPSSGLNINADLSMNNNNLISIKSARFMPQSVLSGPSDLDCLFVNGVDLYYNDGVGNHVRITQAGGVAGTPGSIAGLTSPASATYVAGSQTFVWQSDANTPANMDNASVILRNLVANSFGLTLQPPNAMGADYNLTLPTLPASQKIMTLDAAGNMSAPYVVDNVTIEITANTIKKKNPNVAVVSINTTTTNANSTYLVDTTAGNISITLQTAVGGYQPITVKKISTDANVVLILTVSGQTIDLTASGTPQLSAVNDAFTFESDNANHKVVASHKFPISALYGKGSNQTIANATDTQVDLASATGGGVTFVGGGAMTILYDGLYNLVGNCRFATNGAGVRQLFIKNNGTTIIGSNVAGLGAGVDNLISASLNGFPLAAGDSVTLSVYQSSGGNLDLLAPTSYANSLSVVRVGVIGGV